MTAQLTRPLEGALRGSGGAPAGRRRRPVSLGTVVQYLPVAVIMLVYLFPLAFLLNTALKSNAEFFANPNGIAQTFEFGNFPTAPVYINLDAISALVDGSGGEDELVLSVDISA